MTVPNSIGQVQRGTQFIVYMGVQDFMTLHGMPTHGRSAHEPPKAAKERLTPHAHPRTCSSPSHLQNFTARGHYVCSCKYLCGTKLSRCEMQIGLCAAIVVLEIADLFFFFFFFFFFFTE